MSTSRAKYKYASQGNLILVRELSGKFALLILWTPCCGLSIESSTLPLSHCAPEKNHLTNGIFIYLLLNIEHMSGLTLLLRALFM